MNNTIYVFAWGNNPKRAELKGRPCKILAQGALNSCEVEFVDTGQREIVSRRALRAIKCQWCRQPLIEFDFNREYCVRLCDDHECRLYAQPQGFRERSYEEGEAYMQRRKARIFMSTSRVDGRYKDMSPERRAANDRRKVRRGYGPWLERKKKNYRKLRDLGYTCKEALRSSSEKRMRELGLND